MSGVLRHALRRRRYPIGPPVLAALIAVASGCGSDSHWADGAKVGAMVGMEMGIVYGPACVLLGGILRNRA